MKYDVITTREPTKKSVIGGIIERILYNDTKVPDEVLALLFAADRTYHTIETIIPALNKRQIVVSDRYVYSSLAYQSRGMKKKLDVNWIKTINQIAIEPDLVVFLDITPEESMLRLQEGQKRVQDHNFFETLPSQVEIRNGYYDIFNFDGMETLEDGFVCTYSLNNMKILRIDATLPIKQIREIVGEHVTSIIKIKNIERISKKKKATADLKAFFNVSASTITQKNRKEHEKKIINTIAADSDVTL